MQRRLPPLGGLRAFEAAARWESFKRAADELHVTPAAVSQQVKALEEDLGVPLFRRMPRGLALTDDGRDLLPDLTAAFGRIGGAVDRLGGRSLEGRLTVSVLPSFGAGWLIPRLPDFQARFPGIDILLYSDFFFTDLVGGDADLAIRYSASAFPGLDATFLMDEELYPVVSPAVVNRPSAVRRPKDLATHAFLHDDGAIRSEPWLQWDPWLREAGLDPEIARRGPRFTDTSHILQAAVLGQGIAIGRSPIVRDMLADGRLIRPLNLARKAAASYWVVTPTTGVSPRAQAFRDWVLGQAT